MYQPKDKDVRRFVTYMAIERNCAERTAHEYARDIERFAASIAPRPLLKAKTREIRAWVNGMMEDGSNQPQSVHRKISALAAFFKWCLREDLRDKDPMLKIEKPKCGKRLPKCMTTDEVTTLMSSIDTLEKRPFYVIRARAIMELLYGSGLRRSETLDLTLADIDLEKRSVHLVGKGNKDRYSFLSEPSCEALKAWLAIRPAGSDALFTKSNGKKLSARQGWVIFRTIADRAKLKRHIVPHTMRHSFATHMLEGGADIMTIKELLGHESVATTQVYTNVSMAHMRSTFEKTHPRAGAGQPKIEGEEHEYVDSERTNAVRSVAHAGGR